MGLKLSKKWLENVPVNLTGMVPFFFCKKLGISEENYAHAFRYSYFLLTIVYKVFIFLKTNV